jgi:hypothetical protein
MVGYIRFLVLCAALTILASVSFAETTCTVNNCDIKITVKIAFSGANDSYIGNAEKEIEDVWNGPDGYRLVGDCKCRMTFDVITAKAADCQNSPPAGYHCVMVTDFNNNPPRNQTNWTGARFYAGYMYGIATGNGSNDQQGWWSSIMSRPVDPNNPGGTHYNDFAHEAGHMMGLNDSNDGGIMNNTLASPTQQNLEDIAKNICGPNPCPDRCCCGNGIVDGGKGEQCDPMATPTGCAGGAACCPVCCSCFKPLCIAANGEYLTQSACQAGCGPDASCYMNYKTGCWDCVKQTVVVEKTCRDSTNIRGNLDCDHSVWSFTNQSVDLYKNKLAYAPVVGGLFANERINVKTSEGDTGYLITQTGDVTDYGTTLLNDPTVTLSTNRETVRFIAGGEMTVQQALSAGNITIQGNDFVSGIKFGFYGLMFGIYDFFNPAGEFVPPAAEPELPQEYYDTMGGLGSGAEASPGETAAEGLGELPDGGYFGSDVFPA